MCATPFTVNFCGGDSGSLWAVNGAVQSLRVTVSISTEDWVEDHLYENYGDD